MAGGGGGGGESPNSMNIKYPRTHRRWSWRLPPCPRWPPPASRGALFLLACKEVKNSLHLRGAGRPAGARLRAQSGS